MVWHCDSLVQVLALALDSSEAPVGGVLETLLHVVVEGGEVPDVNLLDKSLLGSGEDGGVDLDLG